MPGTQYGHFSVSAHYTSGGYTVFAWHYTSVTFQLQWSNVLWDVLGIPPMAPAARIAPLVSTVMASAPSDNFTTVELPLVELPLTAVVRARVTALLYGAVLLLPDGLGDAFSRLTQPESGYGLNSTRAA